jgi:hypothetical protein
MNEKCVLCEEAIEENYGKLLGTVIRSKNELGINELIHVCNGCQKINGWHEAAAIKGA